LVDRISTGNAAFSVIGMHGDIAPIPPKRLSYNRSCCDTNYNLSIIIPSLRWRSYSLQLNLRHEALTMSLSRFFVPLISSSTAVSKFASSTASSASRSCSQTPRNFSSTARVGLSSKRELQTTAAYRPYTLDPPPAPPRNSGIPDTSIAREIPEVNDTRPPRVQREVSLDTPSQEISTVCVTENEAQKSKPVITSTPSALSQSASPSASKPKRSKLRPRKAAMSLTSSATKQLRNLLSQPEPKLIRVGVKNRGCSGLAYNLEYVDNPGVFDETVEQDGVKVLIDSKALFSIIGSEMDWVEDKLNQRFVFRNPNISKSPS